MLLLVIRCFYVFVCTGAIAALCFGPFAAPPETGPTGISDSLTPSFVEQQPFLAFFILETIALSVLAVDYFIPRKRVDIVSAIYIGLLIGVVLSYLLMQALSPLFASPDIFGSPGEGSRWKAVASLVSILMLTYLCITFLLQTKDDFRFVIPYVEFSRDLKGGRPMLVDSSALIDGRIADLLETAIIDAELVVPQFVLQEVQEVADSSDKIRRARGRRGLDVLRKLQNEPGVDIRVHETDPLGKGGNRTADQRIVELAKQLGGRIVTSDYNLNKLAGVQGLNAVNLNDVANALKPKFLPGDRMHIKVVREGENPGQGVGYLDDGTMVVCEGTAEKVGREADVVVTSTLQNSAGRMIFARPEGMAGSDSQIRRRYKPQPGSEDGGERGSNHTPSV